MVRCDFDERAKIRHGEGSNGRAATTEDCNGPRCAVAASGRELCAVCGRDLASAADRRRPPDRVSLGRASVALETTRALAGPHCLSIRSLSIRSQSCTRTLSRSCGRVESAIFGTMVPELVAPASHSVPYPRLAKFSCPKREWSRLSKYQRWKERSVHMISFT